MSSKQQFNSFKEFYPFYLSQHQNKINRLLHFVGLWLVLLLLVYAYLMSSIGFVILAIVAGYGFAWIGHYVFEKNKPATFEHPFYSFMADWVMFKDIFTGDIKIF